VKDLFWYLQGTKDYKLTYTKGEDGLAFTTYCDASHGDCVDTGRSTGAYITCMGGCYDVAESLGIGDSGLRGENVGGDESGERVGVSGMVTDEVGGVANSCSVASSLFQNQEVG
jgi:hypothetical protein